MPHSKPSGRHFLQIPGPSNVPDRILRAMDFPTIDHRGPEFAELGKKCLLQRPLWLAVKHIGSKHTLLKLKYSLSFKVWFYQIQLT